MLAVQLVTNLPDKVSSGKAALGLVRLQCLHSEHLILCQELTAVGKRSHDELQSIHEEAITTLSGKRWKGLVFCPATPPNSDTPP
jgi:hypothetical protein